MQFSYKGNEKPDNSIELIIEKTLEIPDMYINNDSPIPEYSFIIAINFSVSMYFKIFISFLRHAQITPFIIMPKYYSKYL